MHNSMYIPFHLLERITNGFSEEQKVGHGGYADVYRAVHNGEEIAVKKLRQNIGLDDKAFDNEFRNLNKVQHPNIVRLVGYCHESRKIYVDENGELIGADDTRRVLCFEYVLGGSLKQHIRDEEPCGLEWPTCYEIIRGTCEGLNHLHSAQEKSIYHLDIKPANILLDENMTPKIADLGLSRLLAETHKTENIEGTHGYMPPEYIDHGCISNKFDVFSLGVVIIKIMAGNMGYSSCYEMSPQRFIEHVIGKWRPRLQGTSRYSSHEIDILQVKACVEIALRCVEKDRHKRPTIKDIVHELDKLEDESRDRIDQERSCPALDTIYVRNLPDDICTREVRDHFYKICSVFKLVDEVQLVAISELPIQLSSSASGMLNPYYQQAENLLRISAPKRRGQTSTGISPLGECPLGVHPLELRFPFEPNKRIPCHLSLTNKTDYRAFFRVIPSCPDRYWKICYHGRGCVNPLQGCQCPDGFNEAGTLLPRSTDVITVIMEGQQQPPPDTDTFIVMMLSVKSIGFEINTEADFLDQVERRGGEAHVAMLTAVACGPASETMTHEIISTREFGDLTSIDVHPTQPWILTSHDDGYVSIWSYHTQEKLKAVRVTKEKGVLCCLVGSTTISSVYSAKFIARKKWFVAGDDYGYIHVYSFEIHKIKKFEAHPRCRVYSLAVHATCPLLLSSSQDHLIKLWDWDDGWMCTQTFKGHTSGVYQVIFNPMDPYTFASAGSDVKVWTTNSSNPNTTLDGRYSVDYYLAGSDPQYMITSSVFKRAYIRDLQRDRRVHTLGEWVNVVACHPALPILVTGSIDGTVCLWNATNYRLEKMVDFMLGSVIDLGFINRKDFRRLVVGCCGGIAIMEINLPTLVHQQSDNS